MMTSVQFKELTKARGVRDKIVPVDNQLDAYNAAFATVPRDFSKLGTQLRTLRNTCATYLTQRPKSDRAPGVKKLQKVIDLEVSVLDTLLVAQRTADLGGKGRLYLKAQETQLENQRSNPEYIAYISGLLKVVSDEWAPVNTALGAADDTTAEGQSLVRDDIESLKHIATLKTTPGLIRTMLNGILAARNLQQISPAINMPSAKYNQTRTPGMPKYTVSHRVFYDGGIKFRLGALVHELTHVAVAEVFNNTVLMFAMPRGASDDEWMTVSRTRRAALQALKSLANSDPELNNSYYSQEFLVSNMRIQCDYALGTKVSNYLATFKTQIEATEGTAFIPRITALTSRGLGSELIEYDSVINQMLIWCWMLHVSEDNPVYMMLESLAAAEMVRRARQMPKPVRPAAVARPVVPTGRPLPVIPRARV